MNGVAEKGTPLESIKMTKSPKTTDKFCRRVVGGLVNIDPQAFIRLLGISGTEMECIFTKIDDYGKTRHMFMVQNVMAWPVRDKFSCQVWYLGETDITQIQQHWNEI